MKGLLLFFVTLLYFLYAAAWDFSGERVSFEGDQVRLVYDVDAVASGDRKFTGSYSITGPNHPGPLHTYLLAMFYMFDRDIPALYRRAAALKSLTFFLLGLFLLRAGASFGLAATVPFMIAATHGADVYLRIIWGPAMCLPFLALALWAALRLHESSAQELSRPLLLLAAALSFLLQTHTSQLPFVLGIGGCAVGSLLLRLRDESARRGVRRAVIGAVLVTLLLWMLPVYEAVKNGGGNFARLFEYYVALPLSSSGDGLTFARSIERLMLVLRTTADAFA